MTSLTGQTLLTSDDISTMDLNASNIKKPANMVH
jgi:hypothetical protein